MKIYSNVGRTMKFMASILCVTGIMVTIVMFIKMLKGTKGYANIYMLSYMNPITYACLFLVVGLAASYVLNMFLYGLGIIVDYCESRSDTDEAIARYNEELSKRKVEAYKEAAKKEKD